MHWESVGSQLVIQVKVSSTQTSIQTPLRSKSLKTPPIDLFNWNLNVLTDNLDQLFDPLDAKRPGSVAVKRRISFWIICLFNSFLLKEQPFFSHGRELCFYSKIKGLPPQDPYFLKTITTLNDSCDSQPWVIVNHDESLWVIMSLFESLWVIISHTYAYSLINHIISTFIGFTTWLRSQPWFKIMEFHKKWI